MTKQERIRPAPIAFENWTRPEERGTGVYLIEVEGPDGIIVTDFVPYRVGCMMAKRQTQYHQNVRLTARLESFDPPALD